MEQAYEHHFSWKKRLSRKYTLTDFFKKAESLIEATKHDFKQTKTGIIYTDSSLEQGTQHHEWERRSEVPNILPPYNPVEIAVVTTWKNAKNPSWIHFNTYTPEQMNFYFSNAGPELATQLINDQLIGIMQSVQEGIDTPEIVTKLKEYENAA